MATQAESILESHKDAARRVCNYLATEHRLSLKNAVALEIVARVLGAPNWQTLQGMAKEGRVPRMADLDAGPVVTAGNMVARASETIDKLDDTLDKVRTSLGSPTSEPQTRPALWQPKGADRPLMRTLPSQDWVSPGFIWELSRGFSSTNETGKWCVFRRADQVDALWEKVVAAVREGKFAAALVSSARQAKDHDGSHVICAFTRDWRNKDDVMRAWQVLRDMGVTEELGYKRDIETMNNVFGVPEEWYYRA